MNDILEFDSLELKYDTRSLLSSVYMKCEVGEVVGLLGRNGSGKSSLMKVVFGALRGDHQSIRINGRHLPQDYIPKRLIAYLPQEDLIPSFLSVRKALQLFGIPEEDILSQFEEIKEFLNLKPKQLSGGYLRVIEAMLILKSKAPFCILDEPFSGLMPIHVEKLKELIKAEKNKKGIIVTDHLYRDVLAITDRLYLLANGKTFFIKHEDDLIARGYINSL
jgi:ABC-type multidrug transport system ATPase subunit